MSKPIEINWEHWEEQKKEGEGHIKFGVGVGAFGAGSLALIGATCPLCFFVAPAMVGVGIWKRQQAKKQLAQCELPDAATDDPTGPRRDDEIE